MSKKLPLDCWSNVVLFLKRPRDFNSICLVVRGFYEYIQNVNPGCCRWIMFRYGHKKLGNDSIVKGNYVRYLGVNVDIVDETSQEKEQGEEDRKSAMPQNQQFDKILSLFPQLEYLDWFQRDEVVVSEDRLPYFNDGNVDLKLRTKSRWLKYLRIDILHYRHFEIDCSNLNDLRVIFHRIELSNLSKRKFSFSGNHEFLKNLQLHDYLVEKDGFEFVKSLPSLESFDLRLSRLYEADFDEPLVFSSDTMKNLKLENVFNPISVKLPNLKILHIHGPDMCIFRWSEGSFPFSIEHLEFSSGNSEIHHEAYDLYTFSFGEFWPKKFAEKFNSLIKRCEKIKSIHFFSSVFLYRDFDTDEKLMDLHFSNLLHLEEIMVNMFYETDYKWSNDWYGPRNPDKEQFALSVSIQNLPKLCKLEICETSFLNFSLQKRYEIQNEASISSIEEEEMFPSLEFLGLYNCSLLKITGFYDVIFRIKKLYLENVNIDGIKKDGISLLKSMKLSLLKIRNSYNVLKAFNCNSTDNLSKKMEVKNEKKFTTFDVYRMFECYHETIEEIILICDTADQSPVGNVGSVSFVFDPCFSGESNLRSFQKLKKCSLLLGSVSSQSRCKSRSFLWVRNVPTIEHLHLFYPHVETKVENMENMKTLEFNCWDCAKYDCKCNDGSGVFTMKNTPNLERVVKGNKKLYQMMEIEDVLKLGKGNQSNFYIFRS